MKKILVLTFAFVMTAGMAFADMMVAPNALPGKITQFVNANFPGAQVMYAERDYDSFEVKLNTGVELDFYANGDWKEVKTFQNFPTQILPAAVALLTHKLLLLKLKKLGMVMKLKPAI